MSDELAPPPEELESERFQLPQQVEAALEQPMTVLAVVWLVLVVVEFTIAPQKVAYLRHNWLTAMSLRTAGTSRSARPAGRARGTARARSELGQLRYAHARPRDG